MGTTNIVFIVLWVMTVLPLVLFNINKIIVKKDDGNRAIKVPRLIVIVTLTLIISFVLLGTYNVTIDYQPKLVSDRFINTLTADSFENAKEDFDPLLHKDMDSQALEDMYNAIPHKGGRFQVGERVLAKYFHDREDFPSDNVSEGQEDVVCVILRVDKTGEGKSDTYTHHIIRLRLVDDIRWKIDGYMEVSEEALIYAERYALIKKEHAGTWYRF